MTDHANELRRHARKIGYPAGDVPSVMLAAADEIERLQAKIEQMESQQPAGSVESLFDEYVILVNNFDRAAPVYLAPGAKGEEK